MIHRLLSSLMLNRKFFQGFWQFVYGMALAGMNMGSAGEVSSSGERRVFQHFLSKLRHRPVVFDVGANRGQWARMALEATSAIDLYCFEPSSSAFIALRANLSGFPSAHLFKFGFANKITTNPLYSNEQSSGLASIFPRRLDHFGISMAEQEIVQLTTLTQFCEDHQIVHIDFLKLDAEGAELQILNGGKSLLENDNIDHIQFEFGGCNIDSRTFFQDFWYLLTPKFDIYRIIPGGLFRLWHYQETLECFVTTNYLAIRS